MLISRKPLFDRQSSFGPLARLLVASEGEQALQRLFRVAGAIVAPERPKDPVAFAGMSRLFELAARLMGDEAFGFRVGAGMSPSEFGRFADFAFDAPSLRMGIHRAGRLSGLQNNALKLALDDTGSEAIWSLNYRREVASNCYHHAVHSMPAMMGLLKRFVGPRAMPTRIDVAMPPFRGASLLEDLAGVPVWSGAGRFAIVFPAAWLDAAVTRRPGGAAIMTTSDVFSYYTDRLPDTTAEALSIVMEPILEEGDLSLDRLASILGLSRRKIQRDLNADGIRFRDMLLAARMKRAQRLMLEGPEPIVQIALAVGYSDQSHFHRAFTAHVGAAPGRWRVAMGRREGV